MEYFVAADPSHIKKQRNLARELKQSQWWKQKLAEGVCHYCQEKIGKDGLTMDHIVPLARGGLSKKSNVVPCCKDCNTNKKYFTPAELVLSSLNLSQDSED